MRNTEALKRYKEMHGNLPVQNGAEITPSVRTQAIGGIAELNICEHLGRYTEVLENLGVPMEDIIRNVVSLSEIPSNPNVAALKADAVNAVAHPKTREMSIVVSQKIKEAVSRYECGELVVNEPINIGQSA